MRAFSAVAVVALACAGPALSAPASGDSVHSLGKRWFAWPGRLFGSDRWGIVLGPRPHVQLFPSPESSSPSNNAGAPGAINPEEQPSVVVSETSWTRTTIIIPASVSAATATGPSLILAPTPIKSTSTVNRTTVLSQATIPRTTVKPTSKPPAPAPTKPATSSHAPAPVPTSTRSTVKPAPPATTSTPKPPPSSGGGNATSSSDIAAYLKGHNDERAKHGASPLTWSDALAAKAQQWVNGCVFKHSGGTLGPFGENLAAGSTPFAISAGITAWNNEAPQYNPSNPQASHWTQVVWKASTQLGCAIKTCNGIFASGPADYIVCEYSPAGNVINFMAQNVQP